MVARSTDAPRTPRERVDDASAQLAGLRRKMSKGSPALRSDAGVMRLVGGKQAPMLTPDDADSAVQFTNSGLEVRDTTGTGYRDIAAKDANLRVVTAELGITGNRGNFNELLCYGRADIDSVNARLLSATQGINADLGNFNRLVCYGNGSFDGLVVNGLTVQSLASYFQDTHHVGVFCQGIRNTGRTTSAGFTDTLASRRELKRDVVPLDHSALDAVRRAPILRWRYRPDAFEGVDAQRQHTGPMVDDLPSGAVVDGEHGPVPELGGMLRYAWEAIRELGDKVEAQAAEIVALRKKVDGQGGGGLLSGSASIKL